jgi:hypothetical protein
MLGRWSAHTLRSLHEAIHASFTPEPITADLSTTWDVKFTVNAVYPSAKKLFPSPFLQISERQGRICRACRNVLPQLVQM